MKKIIVAIIAIMLTSSLFAATVAADTAASKAKKRLSADMRVMLESTVLMQKATYYDDKRVLRKATAELISSLDSLLHVKASTYLSKENKHAERFAKKRVTMIKMYAEDLLLSLDAGNMPDVISDYNQISAQCYSCHLRLR